MLNIAGIPVEVRRKRIKNLHLYVKPPDGRVLVTAPLAMSDETITQFVQTKAAWLKKHVEKYQNRPRPAAPPQYITGETLPVWGRPYRLEVRAAARYSLTLAGDTALLTAPAASTAQQRERFLREWYRARLKPEIACRLPAWETATGLRPAAWQTKWMTTRWGTCNTKTKKLWFAVQLAQKPPECLDYVILHEILHLKERGHNQRFYGLLDFYMAGWRERKAGLR